jgi:hypothetical protein
MKKPVAEGVAAFAGADGNTRRRAQGVLESASLSRNTSYVSTVMLRGVLTIGLGNFGEASRLAL